MFVYGSIQDKLGIKKTLLMFCVGCEIFLGPFFTWIYVPMLKSQFYVGVLLGSLYLSVTFLATSPTFEALAERMEDVLTLNTVKRVLGVHLVMLWRLWWQVSYLP